MLAARRWAARAAALLEEEGPGAPHEPEPPPTRVGLILTGFTSRTSSLRIGKGENRLLLDLGPAPRCPTPEWRWLPEPERFDSCDERGFDRRRSPGGEDERDRRRAAGGAADVEASSE
jgi:hypothetical protein